MTNLHQCLNNIIYEISKTRFTLEEIFPDSSRIRNVFVPDSFCCLHTGGRIRNKNVPVWSSPEILNPEFKVGTLYPNTFESGKFCSVNDSFNKSGYFPPAFLYLFGNIFTLVKILSRLKRLTS